MLIFLEKPIVEVKEPEVPKQQRIEKEIKKVQKFKKMDKQAVNKLLNQTQSPKTTKELTAEEINKKNEMKQGKIYLLTYKFSC